MRKSFASLLLSMTVIAGFSVLVVSCTKERPVTSKEVRQNAEKSLEKLNNIEIEIEELNSAMEQIGKGEEKIRLSLDILEEEVNNLREDYAKLLEKSDENLEPPADRGEGNPWLTVILVIIAVAAIVLFWQLMISRHRREADEASDMLARDPEYPHEPEESTEESEKKDEGGEASSEDESSDETDEEKKS